MTDVLDFAVDLESVRQRVLGLQYFLTVEDAETAAFVIASENALPPAAFVSVASEVATPNKLIGGQSQRVDVVLSVLFAEAAAHAARDSADRMEATRKAVIRQLVAWTPDRAELPLQYRAYQLRSIGDGILWGEVTFGTNYRLTI